MFLYLKSISQAHLIRTCLALDEPTGNNMHVHDQEIKDLFRENSFLKIILKVYGQTPRFVTDLVS